MDFDYLAPTQQLDSSDTEDLNESSSSSKIFGIVKVSGENIQEESFEIRRGENVIGRDLSQCQIVLQCQVRNCLSLIIAMDMGLIMFYFAVLVTNPCYHFGGRRWNLYCKIYYSLVRFMRIGNQFLSIFIK